MSTCINYTTTSTRHIDTLHHTATIPMSTGYTPTLLQTQHQLHVHNTDTDTQYTYIVPEIIQFTRVLLRN